MKRAIDKCIIKAIEDERMLFLYAVISGKKIAELRAVFDNNSALLSDIIIPNNRINCGIGSKLIDEFEKKCIDRRIFEISGNLSDADLDHKERLIHFYEKHGYTIDYQNEEKNFWGRINKKLY